MKKVISNGLVIFSVIYALGIIAIFTYTKKDTGDGTKSEKSVSHSEVDGPGITYDPEAR